ncbi:hypothetical protein [Methanobacterium sp.]|uniref:HVO_A0114 family putative DNA-binding protein n=1 Tax=Methanobacterium sp. TaxID=2164 RepID=UPI0025FF8792|nr:hypothetical protein [Methanobacterium sp.]MBI5460460.1 hypothetical protein [Methanobacterium sp.]
MKITLIKTITGEKLIQELEETYGSLDRLERLHDRNPDNMKVYTDMDDWKYYQDHLDEVIEETKGVVTEKLTLGTLEMEMLNFIKYKKPESIRELARMIHKDVRSVQPKVRNLEKQGLIQFKEGPKRKLMPILNYDKIEIEV